MTRTRGVLSVLVLLAFGFVSTRVRADPAPGDDHHVRLSSPHGAVHVWTPRGYAPATAITVVYVHGYFANVDDAWTAYHLDAQFRASLVNALFIVCEAPTRDTEPVRWTSVADLLAFVAAAEPLPSGRVVAIGHSGAHRTIASWLDEPTLDTVALVDAAYGKLDAYRAWLDARDGRRLIDVGDLTRAATDAFHDALPESLVIERFPPPERGALPDPAAEARIVYVRSAMGHMPLVTGGVALPMILRALMAPLVDDADRNAPLNIH